METACYGCEGTEREGVGLDGYIEAERLAFDVVMIYDGMRSTGNMYNDTQYLGDAKLFGAFPL